GVTTRFKLGTEQPSQRALRLRRSEKMEHAKLVTETWHGSPIGRSQFPAEQDQMDAVRSAGQKALQKKTEGVPSRVHDHVVTRCIQRAIGGEADVSARQRAARQQFEVTEFEAAFDGIWFVAHPETMTSAAAIVAGSLLQTGRGADWPIFQGPGAARQ